jgi:hypothetical protein
MAFLLSSFGKKGVQLGLLSRKVDIEDTQASSKYFAISEFNPVFSAGKNAFSFNGSAFLKDKSEIQIECLDSQGNSLYLEQAKATIGQFTDTAKFVTSIHVYNETYNGPGKLILVGTTKKGEVVRWIGNIAIDKTINNTSKVRFYNTPSIEVNPLLYPVIDLDAAQTDWPPPPATQAATAVALIESGVGSVTVTATGTGYTTATVLLVGGTLGTPATAVAVISGGAITAIHVTSPGVGYTSAPIVQITGDGAGAAANAVLSSHVKVPDGVSITNSGLGYTFTPSVKFVPSFGFGSGAVATATVVGGVVTNVTVTSGGNGYIVAPTVVFDIPLRPPAAALNVSAALAGAFYTYAADPLKDTNKNLIDPKRTNVDYRLIYSNIDPADLVPNKNPSKQFNVQMEGKTITLTITRVQVPGTSKEEVVNETFTTTIKKVLDTQTIQLTDPYYYTVGKNQFLANIVEGTFVVSYRLILYNTNPDSNKKYTPPETGVPVNLKESYAEIVYRNIRPYSGFVARHKVYRKSSFSPGDFQLISDELLPSVELLLDPITFNRFYDRIGTFYHLQQIQKYWFSSNPLLTLEATRSPINSMKIGGADPSTLNGTDYVIAKLDTIGVTNTSAYIPFDAAQFADLAGASYNSNFINLKRNSNYVMNVDIQMDKPLNEDAKVEFFFTSSISSIRQEKNFVPLFGLKLGEISCTEAVTTKYFKDTQQLYFTPSDDYYGTLVIVPTKCHVTLSNLSMKVYGDFAFSPDVLVIRAPFSVKVPNEAFDIKAELLDINSAVVFSNVRTVQTFDANGESLNSVASQNPVNTVIQITNNPITGVPATTVIGVPYLPDIPNETPDRFVGLMLADGKLVYSNVSKLYIDSDDYITMGEYQSGVEHIAKSVAVRYDFAHNEGRKIFIDLAGNKETFP